MRLNFHKDFLMQILYFCFYLFALWFMNIIVVSIISFFHFQLGHRLGTIENWLFEQGWAPILISKLLAFLVLLKISQLRLTDRALLGHLLIKSWRPPRIEMMASFLFLAFFIIWFGSPQLKEAGHLNIWEIVVSFFSSLVFYSIDFSVILVLEYIFGIEKKSHLFLKIFGLSYLLFEVQRSSFLYAANFKGHVWVFLAIGAALVLAEKINWSWPLLFLWLIVAPISAVFGLDPLWGDFYSPLHLLFPLSPIHYFGLSMVIFFYFHVLKSKQLSYTFNSKRKSQLKLPLDVGKR